MLVLRKVAITGGLAAGKTSVCRILESCDAYVVSADDIVHQLLSPNTKIGQQVIELLGSDISSGKEFDRKKISERVFLNPEKLHALEKILHPAVFDEIEKRYNQIKDQTEYSIFVAEIPLLYESKRNTDFYDVIVAVVADENLCARRFGSIQEYTQRMKRQFSQEHKKNQADFTIVNNGDLEQLKTNVLNLFLKELHPQ
ncbi:MAG: dephospho-CoA kinase [Chlamydiota bacterium]